MAVPAGTTQAPKCIQCGTHVTTDGIVGEGIGVVDEGPDLDGDVIQVIPNQVECFSFDIKIAGVLHQHVRNRRRDSGDSARISFCQWWTILQIILAYYRRRTAWVVI